MILRVPDMPLSLFARLASDFSIKIKIRSLFFALLGNVQKR